MASDPKTVPVSSAPAQATLQDGTGTTGSAPTSSLAPLYAADILERVADAFFALDSDWKFTYLNSHAERLLARPRVELLGRAIWDEFPAAVGTVSEREYRRAMQEQIVTSFEQFYPPLDSWFEAHAYPSSDGLSIYFSDITERKRSEEALRRSEERLRDTQTRLESALSAGGIATWTWDMANDRLVADASLNRLFSISPEEAGGGAIDVYLRAIHPDDRPRVAQAIDDALAYQDSYEAEYRIVLPDGSHRWLATRGRVERDEAGQAVSFPGVMLDITERAERRRRERFLTELAERARTLITSHEVMSDAVISLGQFLGLSRCTFADIDMAADTCTISVDYCADESVASAVGVLPFSAFGSFISAEFQAGRAVVVNDVRADPVQVPAESVATYEAIGVRAHITAPVLHSAQIVSCIGCHSATPRNWTPDEVDLVQTVVERTWLTVEVIRQRLALAYEAEERRGAHERIAAILESITDAFYALDSQFRFTHVNRQAELLWGRTRAEMLGKTFLAVFPQAAGSSPYGQHERVMAERRPTRYETVSPIFGKWVDVSLYPTADGGLSVFFRDISTRKALEAERERLADANRLLLESTGDGIYGIDLEGCFTFLNRAAERMLGFTREQLIGHNAHTLIHHTWPDGTPYPEAECPIFQTLRDVKSSRIAEDVFWCADGTALPVAYVASPILEDGAEQGVVVTFSDISERKALEEEQERVAERERNIAAQLQTALQPDLPGTVPGLAVTKYYKAALAEAGVGGDFYDVFAVEKGCTALVVGDLSGKGLAAAAQVSLVRNMLRYALYSQSTVAAAVTDLNRILSENNLLTGFTTLFVGAHDSATGQLKYVNCGQEPALVRRAATGAVERLDPTGPILGAIEHAQYTESVVSLGSGDAVAIFTDGLTEVGPRTAMLGVEGVIGLLSGPVPEELVGEAAQVAEALSRSLVSGTNGYAQSAAQDDMCLIIGVVP